MQVKICGITRPSDGVDAVLAGAHAVGLVFYERSKRAVSVERAIEICQALPPLTQIVGLFVNAGTESVQRTLDQVPLNLLQFHGDESAEYCTQFGHPWIKALPALPVADLTQRMEDYAAARGILLDSAAAGQFGGTGEAFDWQVLPQSLPQPIVLAGGLDPANVEQAVRIVRPTAVDVSSGVESAPGIKDKDKIQRFVANAMAAAQECAI